MQFLRDQALLFSPRFTPTTPSHFDHNANLLRCDMMQMNAKVDARGIPQPSAEIEPVMATDGAPPIPAGTISGPVGPTGTSLNGRDGKEGH